MTVQSDWQKRFAAELARLNDRQLQAVQTTEGPVLVFAGPGTGKTQVLTLRIANLIAQGLAEPEQILALTFTQAAAVNMRSRLVKLVGTVGLRINFGTFHEFCAGVIADHPEAFPFAQDARPLGELEKIAIFEQLIGELPLTALRPPGKKNYYLRAMMSAIDQLKQENVTPTKYETLVAQRATRLAELIAAEQDKKRPSRTKIAQWQKEGERQRELQLVYAAYQERLAAGARFDFADMILQVETVFRTQADVLAEYQERYQYLLADEYQDTNAAQDAVLQLLAAYWGEQANVFVVGDPWQSIYRFQGANMENFLGFAKRFPAAQIIHLDTGYRCSDQTYQLAWQLTQTLTPLTGDWQEKTALHNFAARTGEPAILTQSLTRDGELINIMERIKKLLAQGVPADEIAVIYRKNQESGRLMDIASSYQIPFDIEGGVDVLEQPLIQTIITWLRLLTWLDTRQPAAAELAYQLLWWPGWGFDELSVIKLVHACRAQSVSLATVLIDARHPVWASLTGAPAPEWDQLRDWGGKLVSWTAAAHQLTVTDLLAKILAEGEVLEWVRHQPERVPLLLGLYTWQRWVANCVQAQPHLTLAELVANVDLMCEHHLKIPLQDFDARRGAITLTTAHKAKGREWDYVFVCGLNRGVWDKVREPVSITLPPGIITQQTLGEKSDEQKRLFYVAATRARRQNFFSCHLSEETEGASRAKQPADLVYWLQSLSEEKLVIETEELLDGEQLLDRLPALLSPPPARHWAPATRDYLRQRVSELVLSVSMLNDYLKDPQLFVERYLLQAPEDQDSVQLYFGTAMHRALEKMLRPVAQGQEILPLTQVQEIFTRELTRQPVADLDKTTWLRLGRESLADYYDYWREQPPEVVAVEHKLGTWPKIVMDGVPLTGKIDRIDRVADGQVRVIDYKTGRPQSQAELLGKTASSRLSERERQLPEAIRSPYKRQLLFYKLLCELETDFPEEVTMGQLLFVKSFEHKIISRDFPLTSEEVAALRELIRQVWQEIQQLQFLDDISS